MKKYFFFLQTLYFFLNTLNVIYSQTLTSSNLPIVIINTYGHDVDGTPYNTFVAWMSIIDNGQSSRNHLSDTPNSYNGRIKIKLHGSSTLWLPKKSYGITTIDAAQQNLDTSIFGFPAEHDWVFKGLYQDKTFLRDELSFKIFNEMGYYSSRSKFFELVVDGDYRGVYQAEEKIKRDSSRVNIAKLKKTDISGDELTGGYIISLDKFQTGDPGWYSNYYSNSSHDSANYFLYNYPHPDSMLQVQKNYIKNYFNTFENVLSSSSFNDPVNGYSKYLNTNSFIDNFLINEMSRNVDGYRASTYFYKDKDSRGDGKLHAEPIWDFNIAWDNCYYNGGNNSWGWQYQQSSHNNFVPFWWSQFMSDDTFKNELKCRYQYLRNNILSFSNLYSHIDSMATYLNESQARNFARWPIMGQYVWPNPSPIPTSYAGEIGKLKNFIQQRLTWLDANIPGVCSVGINENKIAENLIHVFPNPFTTTIHLVYNIPENAKVKVEILNLLGDMVQPVFNGIKTKGIYEEEIATPKLTEGVYIIKLSYNQNVSFEKLIKVME
jgi:hypothetical protein